MPFLIEHFFSFMTLKPGDLILTSTPDGVVDCRPDDVAVTGIEHRTLMKIIAACESNR